MAGKKKKSFTLEQPLVEAHPYESPKENEPLPDDLVEEFPESEPEIVLSVPKAEPPKKVHVAVTASIGDKLTTAKALKTCKKFVGKWIELQVGKTITDDKSVIAHLRAHGLVE